MGSTTFKQVAIVAKLRKRDFKPPDKVPKNYDLKPFHVDGMIEVDIEFQVKTMKTPVYVKMDAPEELLLSEGVCRQLSIISYHPEVQESTSAKPTKAPDREKEEGCAVSTVRICLVQDIHLIPNECMTAQVQMDDDVGINMQPLLAEGDKALIEKRITNGRCCPSTHQRWHGSSYFSKHYTETREGDGSWQGTTS